MCTLERKETLEVLQIMYMSGNIASLVMDFFESIQYFSEFLEISLISVITSNSTANTHSAI